MTESKKNPKNLHKPDSGTLQNGMAGAQSKKCPIFTRQMVDLSLSLHLKSHFSKMTIISTISVLVSFAWLCYRYGGKAPLFFGSLLLIFSIVLLCAI